MSNKLPDPPNTDAKRPYDPPELRHLGSVREVTATNPNPSGNDGGTYPNTTS